jgi:hypothetical protein
MTSDRWEEINRLYDAAVEVEEKERTSFLEKACGGDAELRREVESLLAYDKQAQQLLDRPALHVTAEKLAGESPSLVGRQLGPYQIQVVLGAGGMGEVYKAKDTRLNRTVAIKVLLRLLSERVDLRQRFEREGRAIASLNHPNICALYDGQFSADGRWVAYTSIESGNLQIYVVPFDAAKVLNTGPGAEISPHDKTQISTRYGSIARWRGDGREIFYLGSKDKEMMAAEVDGRGNSFAARKEQTLFRAAAIAEKLGGFDVTPDGKRFVIATQRVSNPNTPLTLVVNWTGGLGNKR